MGLYGFWNCWNCISLTYDYIAVTRKSLCKELEKELELQIGMKTEMEIAMKLLEKDTHEKQDTLVALRQQLEEVKAINLQMFHKSQVCMYTEENRQNSCTGSLYTLIVHWGCICTYMRLK